MQSRLTAMCSRCCCRCYLDLCYLPHLAAGSCPVHQPPVAENHRVHDCSDCAAHPRHWGRHLVFYTSDTSKSRGYMGTAEPAIAEPTPGKGRILLQSRRYELMAYSGDVADTSTILSSKITSARVPSRRLNSATALVLSVNLPTASSISSSPPFSVLLVCRYLTICSALLLTRVRRRSCSLPFSNGCS